MGQLVSLNGDRFAEYPPIYGDFGVFFVFATLELSELCLPECACRRRGPSERPPLAEDPLAHMEYSQAGPGLEPRPPPKQPEAQATSDEFTLSTADLNKCPEDVFDVVSKVGEG